MFARRLGAADRLRMRTHRLVLAIALLFKVWACARDYDLDEARNDFGGADLRFASVEPSALVGLRWTRSTRWPPHLVEEILNNSVEISEGVWEVRGGSQHDRQYA